MRSPSWKNSESWAWKQIIAVFALLENKEEQIIET